MRPNKYQVVHSISEVIAKTSDPWKVLSSVARLISEFVGKNVSCAIFAYNRNDNTVTLVASQLPQDKDLVGKFTFGADKGIVGLSILLTLIGVHSATASRGANAWLRFATTMIVVLLTAAVLALTKFVPEEKALDAHAEIALCVAPSIIFFPLIGYAISDLRN